MSRQIRLGLIYVLEYEGNLYPTKLILSYVTGQPLNTFSGNEETNNVSETLGFTIRKKKFWVIALWFSEQREVFAIEIE